MPVLLARIAHTRSRRVHSFKQSKTVSFFRPVHADDGRCYPADSANENIGTYVQLKLRLLRFSNGFDVGLRRINLYEVAVVT